MEALNGLINLGAVGAILAYFLVRTDPRLERLENAVDRLARAQMLMLIASPVTDEAIKRQAQSIINELDAAEKR